MFVETRSALKLAGLILGGLLSLSAASWSPGGNMDLRLHGYLAQGWTISDKNNVNGESSESGGSVDFREAGLNVSYRPTGRLLLATQLASVRRGEVSDSDEDVLLDYAVIDYNVWQGQLNKAGIRAGKLKLPFAFFNDARDAIHTRPGVLLPQGIYLDADGARSFGYFSLPGLAAYSDVYVGNHALFLEAGVYPESSLGRNASTAVFRQPVPGEFDHRQSVIMRFTDDISGGRMRVALSLSRGFLEYSPRGDLATCLGASQAEGQPPLCGEGDFRLDQAFLSLEYNAERWSVTAEIARRRIVIDNLIAPGTPVPPGTSSALDQDSAGFYLQGTYRLNPKASAYLRYDERQREMQDRSGHRQSDQTGLPRHNFFARDWVAGAQYDFGNGLGIWGEVHVVDGVGWLNPLDNPQLRSGQASRHWSLATLMLAYRF